MALTLNGNNNTIGGLANGGLPDGCILDADINGMAASKLTGALPAISAASLTNIPSSEGTAKAWLKYEQTDSDVGGNTGNTGISDSFNIDSVNDAGNGQSVVYWDTDFTNTHYAVVGMVAPGPNNDLNQIVQHSRQSGGLGTHELQQTTQGVGLTTARVSDSDKQDAHYFIAAFGDQ
tara:strand:+ start:1599 stop:2129 length:531 start_codon:yes stop_codon:yes gene_type:complete